MYEVVELFLETQWPQYFLAPMLIWYPIIIFSGIIQIEHRSDRIYP